MTIESRKKLVVICGPTGIGKTSVAIELAETLAGEIIGADSMQIYRFMDIGTAKPTAAECARIPHHMVNVADPDEEFDAARYCHMARNVVADVFNRHCLPFVVGGTGLYIKSLLHGVFQAPEVDPDVRQRLKSIRLEKGTEFLHARLRACDPDTAKRIHPNDGFRIVRALEVYETTGTPLSKWHEAHRFSDTPYQALKIGLHMDRQILYHRIDQRVDLMIKMGFKQEVQKLLDMGYGPELKSMQSIGYRHMVQFLMGNWDWDESIRLIKRDTRRYAKRQFTWFKADKRIQWFEPRQTMAMAQCIQSFLESNKHQQE